MSERQVHFPLSRSEAMARQLGVLVAVVGGVVLAGWVFDIGALKAPVPGAVSMKANTALCFILLGTSIAVVRLRPLAWVVVLASAATLTEYATGRDFGIDRWLAANSPRMPPHSATLFLVSGLCVAGLRLRRGRIPLVAQGLSLTVMTVGVVTPLGYLYRAATLMGLSGQDVMAVHTGAAFVAVGFALVCLQPDIGVARLLFDKGPAGILARRLIPAAILIPVLFGFLRLEGQRAGLYGTEIGAGLFVMAMLVSLSGFVLFTAGRIGRLDEERTRYFDLSLDLLCESGTDGYFKRLNPSWERVLGFDRDELLARPFIDFIHPDDIAATQAESSRVREGRDVIEFENRYRCKDGSYRWLAWTARGTRAGQSVTYAAARDVTESKRFVEALRAANAELEAFSYSVSHDLRAPLRHASGFVELHAKHAGASLDEKSRRYMRTIVDSVKIMGRLIDDLLAFSQVGRVELRFSTVSMDALAREAREEFRDDRPIEWTIDPLPAVRGDPALLRQVWVNLLSNAVKYTRPKDVARIHVGAEAGGVFFVKDNGAGFDMQYADKLFGVFQRLHSSSEFEGTGIGLANVRRIVARHGGRTWAEGELGAGATFRFSIPIEEEATHV